MNTRTATTILGYSLLAATAGVSFILPGDLGLGAAKAYSSGTPDVVRLNGTVWDFPSTHNDFKNASTQIPGHVVGLVSYDLGADGTPTFDGSGNLVTNQAKDKSGNNIAPILTSYNEGVQFTISDGKVVTTEAFAAMVTVVGAAINTGSYDMKVTTKLNVGSTTINPFGDFTKAIAGNVNKPGNPRDYVSPSIYAANTPIYVTARSWTKKQSSYSGNSENHWQTNYEFNTNGATQQIKVLRDGDLAPNTAGFLSQLAAKQFLLPYINPVTQRVTLFDNQVIYLFELGTTNMAAASADFQDLVVVLTMAKSSTAFEGGISQPVGCGPDDDTPATLSSTPSTAGIGSASTFKQWFSDSLGNNLSATMPLDLRLTTGSTYVFDDTTDPRYSKLGGFYPADNRMFGDVNASGHNEYFTYSFEADFTYDELANQYFETRSDCEIWVFIDGRLVLDLGGIHSALEQRVDLSRLCLQNGKTYKLQFFMANRYAPQSALRLETNMLFNGEPVIAASALGD